MASSPLFYDLSLSQLEAEFSQLGLPSYRAQQLWQGIYAQLLASPYAITNLPASLREKLDQRYTFEAFEVRQKVDSGDGGTQKFLLELRDGSTIETVLMRYDRRRTACISTQVGCAMGCVFCATGQMGFGRNLSRGEIAAQVLLIGQHVAREGDRLTNVVLMGMGEPLHNYDESLGAIDLLNHPDGFNFGARRFTLSTVGVVPAIDRFTAERRQVNLAVSLHAATDALRDQLLPINRRYPLKDLMAACRRYVSETKRRITFEWALIANVNDQQDQAHALADLLHGLNSHVNIIPLNPTDGYSAGPSTRQRAATFQQLLANAGISCTIRVRRGIDIQAGCGQLATEARSGSTP
jgi:23S rRNA (adenine2503-C2)-methyltransferase